MSSGRFELALKLLKPSDWERFERLASRFFSVEFPTLRTTASPAGDEGRDAELFTPDGMPNVVLQYSVSGNWRAKILRTAKRLSETKPETRVMIYATNQIIGADADQLRADLLKNFQLVLDVRDQNWFLERQYASRVQEKAAEEIVQAIADPYLKEQVSRPERHAVLTRDETRSALVYLELQWEDQGREKGLTKLAFEALVESALRGSSAHHRVARATILERVRSVLPSHPTESVDMYTNAALARLSRQKVRHWRDADEFALSADESIRISDRLATLNMKDARLLEEIRELLIDEAPDDLVVDPEDFTNLAVRVKRILERFFLGRGESLAAGVMNGSFEQLSEDFVEDVITRDFAEHPDRSDLRTHSVDLAMCAVRGMLLTPSRTVQSHLRALADVYTLFSFLSETPDVQKVVSKMFSHGEIWFDTSFLLPVFLEELLEPSERRYSAMLRGAFEAGLTLRVSPGVVEEIETHLYRSLICARMQSGEWKGNVPFVLSGYTLSGKAVSTFGSWIEQFRGERRPQDDISEYLFDVHNIQTTDLEKEVENAPKELVYAVDSLWRRGHEQRRRFSEMDEMMQNRLVRHDVETFVGVLQRRNLEKDSPFGYTSWLITFDRLAEEVAKQLKPELGRDLGNTPLMSADFLVAYLTVGPLRARIDRTTEERIPLLLDTTVQEFMPPEFLEVANRTREEANNLPERLLRRRLRDRFDLVRQQAGPVARKGMGGVMEALRERK
jgi:hypothetical protein